MSFLSSSRQTSDRPRFAVEIAPDGIFAGTSSGADAPLQTTAAVPLQDAISAALTAPVLRDREAVRNAMREAMDSAGEHGRDWTLIVPDACVRVLLLDFDTVPQKHQDVLPLVRFRLRKMIPFDADTAAVSYQVLPPLPGAATDAPVQMMVAAMPAEVREELESVVRETEREPGVLLPAALAALAAVPDTGSHLMVHAAEGWITSAITHDGCLVLYRRFDYSGADPAEIAQSVSISTAYYEDTLHSTPNELLVAGLETPESLRERLQTDGEWRIPLKNLIGPEAFAAAAVPAAHSIGRFAGVAGALRG